MGNAFYDSSAFTAITGQVATNQYDSGALQEEYRHHQADFPSMAKVITKRSFQAQSVEDLGKFLPKAFKLARTGRPGPVHIDVPYDLWIRTADVDVPEPEERSQHLEWRTPGSPEAVARALEMLMKAKRPLILRSSSGSIMAACADGAPGPAPRAARRPRSRCATKGRVPRPRRRSRARRRTGLRPRATRTRRERGLAAKSIFGGGSRQPVFLVSRRWQHVAAHLAHLQLGKQTGTRLVGTKALAASEAIPHRRVVLSAVSGLPCRRRMVRLPGKSLGDSERYCGPGAEPPDSKFYLAP